MVRILGSHPRDPGSSPAAEIHYSSQKKKLGLIVKLLFIDKIKLLRNL